MKLNFVVRKSKIGSDLKAPLELSIIVDGERKVITLDKRIKVERWNKDKQQVAKDRDTNEYISAITSKFYSLENAMLKKGIDITLANILDCFKNGIEGKQRTIAEVWQEVIKLKQHTSKITIDKYKVTHLNFQAFLKGEYSKDDVLIKDITSADCQKFFNYLLSSVGNNTAVQKCKHLNSVLAYAVESGYISVNPFRVKTRIEKLVYQPLTLKEINIIKNKKISNKRLDNVRWLFLFQCVTSFSYADMSTMEFNEEQITEGIFTKLREKTGVLSAIPVLDLAKEILIRYDYKLPLLSNQKYNAYLKELADICGIDKELHSHLARHTFATLLINKGIDINVIARILGHASTRITLSTYAHFMNSTVKSNREKINNIFK